MALPHRPSCRRASCPWWNPWAEIVSTTPSILGHLGLGRFSAELSSKARPNPHGGLAQIPASHQLRRGAQRLCPKPREPVKYHQAETSGITVVVKPGPNALDPIRLEGQPLSRARR
jgi:hypothetical protein